MTLRARPTTYRGIRMRSRLEAEYARQLDAKGARWEYEPRAYADQTGTYLPDFEVLGLRHPTFVEIKGEHDEEKTETAMERMEIIWSSVPDAVLYLVFGDGTPSLVTRGRRWEPLVASDDAA